MKQGHAECGVTKTLKIIGSKWTLLILYYLFEGKKRFGELQQLLVGISPKTLSFRLKELEQSGLVVRTVFRSVPLHVEYELTNRGRALRQVFDTMEAWGAKI